MKSKIITNTEQIKEILKDGITADFAIQLNGGAYSRKEIYYHPPLGPDDETDEEYDKKYRGKFEVLNCIDDTTQILTEEEISDPKSNITNIGKAMAQNAFYHLNYDS